MPFGALPVAASPASATSGATTPGNKSYIEMVAAAARTKGTPVRVGSGAGGYTDVTIASDTNIYLIAVADSDIASGAVGRYQVTGRCSMTTPSLSPSAGQGLKIVSGLVALGTATAQAPNWVAANVDFCVVMTAATSATTQDVYLFGVPQTAA